jgi:hypothetical protein
MQHVKSFSVFESESFDQFMRQAQVAQSGNPYWFGRNPKPKKAKPKAPKKSKITKKQKS